MLTRNPSRPNHVPNDANWNRTSKQWEKGSTRFTLKHGKWTYWKQNGKILSEYHYSNNKKDGAYKLYHNDGNVAEEGMYRSGKLHGERIICRSRSYTHYNLPPNLNYKIWKIITQFDNGIVQSYQYLDRNGNDFVTRPATVPSDARYNCYSNEWELGAYDEENKKYKSGSITRYNRKGIKCGEFQYTNGNLHGKFKRFHPDGTISQKGTYVNNRIRGEVNYYRSEKSTTEYFPNTKSKDIWHVQTDSTQSRGARTKYFLKDGTVVNRHGFKQTSVTLDRLFKSTLPKDFIEKGLEEFLDKVGILKQSNYTLPKAAFKTLWGKEMPEDLAAMLELLGRAGYPNLFGWETSAIELADLTEPNIVKKALLDAQIMYPYDHVMDWFTGAVALDPLVIDTSQGNYYHFSPHYGLYDDTQKGLIYNHYHQNQYSWGTNMMNPSKDLSTYLYMYALCYAFDIRGMITVRTFNDCKAKFKNAIALPYYYVDRVRVNGSDVYLDYQMGYHAPKKVSIDYYAESKWLLELLRCTDDNDHTIRNTLNRQGKNQKITPEKHTENLAAIPINVPEAMYYLFRTFFNKEEAYMLDYIKVAKNSTARIIQDTAKLVEEWHNDEVKLFGEITDLQSKRRTWLA